MTETLQAIHLFSKSNMIVSAFVIVFSLRCADVKHEKSDNLIVRTGGEKRYQACYINFSLKKSIVRCQASSAASLSNRGVVIH